MSDSWLSLSGCVAGWLSLIDSCSSITAVGGPIDIGSSVLWTIHIKVTIWILNPVLDWYICVRYSDESGIWILSAFCTNRCHSQDELASNLFSKCCTASKCWLAIQGCRDPRQESGPMRFMLVILFNWSSWGPTIPENQETCCVEWAKPHRLLHKLR